jgi:hypothetical protein
MIRRWGKKKPPPEHVEAMHAREHADRQLASALEQRTAALSLAEKLTQIRQRNHFGQSLENLNWSKQ